MKQTKFPAPSEGMLITLYLTVGEVEFTKKVPDTFY